MAGKPHPVRWRLEYGAVLAVGALVRALPLAAAQGVAWALARLAHALMAARRREARRRLRLVLGPEAPEREGWTFYRWYANESYSGSPYNFASPVNESITLYARWTPSGD